MVSREPFALEFDLTQLNELDKFALLASQSYNLGNNSDWFSCFRGGIFAVHHRVIGIHNHYQHMHAWIPSGGQFGNVEQHLSDLLFNLDSSMECTIYGLNALGYAANPDGFRDVTDRNQLRKVTPANVIGPQPLSGYDAVFPSFKAHWQANQDLINTITEQHDVSKHRRVAFRGGRLRNDPPEGYFDSLGIPDEPAIHAMHSPMAEIILIPDPKAPPAGRKPTPREEQILLEELVPRFSSFLTESASLANSDARENIKLAKYELEVGDT